jgi:pilus assembly protein CpaB
MNRSTRTFIVVGIAVAVAAVASLGAYEAIKRMPVREVEVRSLYQVVATHDMPMGSLITKDSVKLVAWPASSPVGKGFTTIESVLNRGLIDSVAANEPLTEAKLAPLEAGAGLPPSIPEGMRAVSVKVNEVIGVAGFVVPGTHVDVMVTLSRNTEKDSMTRVVVSDVQVLTAGTRYDQEKARDGEPIPTSVVTLLVTPEDAERIALAATEGQVMLTLRNPMDRKPTETAGVRTSALLGQAPAPAPVVKSAPGRRIAVAPPAPAAVAAPATRLYTVETIRAAKRAEEVVQQ